MNSNGLVMGVLFVLVFLVGFGLGRMSVDGTSSLIGNTATETQTTQQPQGGTATEEGATTVNTNNLTDGQRAMLNAMGIDADTITITPAMVACAEAKLGAARMEEIKNGATPSFSEGASLVACYR